MAAAETSRLMTPGSTTATRSIGSISRMRVSRLSAMTMPSTCGTAPPDRLVPLPRATNGTPASAQSRTMAMTSSPVSGSTTARGRARNVVSPSDSNAARPAAAVTMRVGGNTPGNRRQQIGRAHGRYGTRCGGLPRSPVRFRLRRRTTRMGPCAPPLTAVFVATATVLACASSPTSPTGDRRRRRRRRRGRLHRALQRARPRRLDRRRRRLRGQGRRHRLQAGPGRHAVHHGPAIATSSSASSSSCRRPATTASRSATPARATPPMSA